MTVMRNERLPVVTGLNLDEQAMLTLGDLCRACAVHAEWVIALVDEGVLDPLGQDPAHWRFAGTSLRRVRAALRLQRDLGINLAGAALVLDLIDEVGSLRTRLRTIASDF